MKRQTPASVLHIRGKPNAKQKLFFASRARYTAYGGARGGGKSWALRRKLVALCLRYPTIRCLLVRRSYAELKANHVDPLLREYAGLIQYRESDKRLDFPNGSSISLGYCSSNRDVLRYQGQEYDIIAIDEATQLNEYQFSIFKACLRGVGNVPRRMYLTCNPGGVGHAWVKRLFIDRAFRPDEDPSDYRFIPAQVYDNPVLTAADPDYVRQLESLPGKLRDAWLLGRWDVFEGQFLPEFRPEIHVAESDEIPGELRYFAALDYGFDMLAALLLGADRQGSGSCGNIAVPVWCLGRRQRRSHSFAEVIGLNIWLRHPTSGTADRTPDGAALRSCRRFGASPRCSLPTTDGFPDGGFCASICRSRRTDRAFAFRATAARSAIRSLRFFATRPAPRTRRMSRTRSRTLPRRCVMR